MHEMFSSTTELRQWQVIEISLQATADYADPLVDVDLFADFHGPEDAHMRIPAFWDGDRTWKLRFTPTAPGAWRCTTTCNYSADAGLHGHHASFLVQTATGDNPLYRHGGFLRVSEDHRYLTHTDGTPFFWLGDTWWFCPSHLVPFEGSTHPEIPSMYRTLIDTRRAQGYSVVQMAFLGTSGVSGSYTDLFTHTFNPTYWREVDRYLAYANEAGIIPVIGMGFHQGLNAPTLEQLQVLWRYVLARYGAYAVTFLICGEYNQAGGKDGTFTETDIARIEKMLQVGQYIKDHDPYRRAMTVHPWWWGGEKRQAWDQPWYDFIMLQGGHGKEGPPTSMYRDIYHRTPPKPMLEGECTYEGIFGFDDTVVRHNAYKAVQCGSFGFTYGSHGLWYPNQDADDQKFDDWGQPVPWWEALARPGGAQMRHLRACYESVAWWKLAPRDAEEILELDQPYPSAWQQITVKAEGTATVVLYFPDGQSPELFATLKGLPPGAIYRITLFNPRTGEQTATPVQAVAAEKIQLPRLPDAQDWLMIVCQQ
ncbi:MAG: apiosidase-like domain-containing protein [Armatimonadota bacterium]